MKKHESLVTDTYAHSYYHQEQLPLEQIDVEELATYQDAAVHNHDMIEMLMVHGGTGRISINGMDFLLEAGACVRLFPYHYHRLEADKPLRLELYRCTFPLSFFMYFDIDKSMDDLSFAVLEYQSPVVMLTPESMRQMRTAFESMLDEYRHRQPFGESIILAELLRITSLYNRCAARKIDYIGFRQRPLAWRALQYMHLHFNEEIETAQMARTMNVTPSELGHAIRMLTGQSLVRNLHEVRVRNACAMMRFEELTVTYISRYVGYKTPATFFRAFQQVKGMTPDQYRSGRSEAKAAGKQGDRAWQVLSYLLDHFAENLSVQQVADQLYISRSTLNNLLQESFECGFSELLEQIRLSYACALLGATGLQVYDIAIAVGYNSVRTFSRSFGRVMNTTPRQYRQGLAQLPPQGSR